METELLKEPWVFPRSKVNPTKEEDNTAFSAWEENFQDLSGWCMDTFQGQCDFHIGESSTFKLSGTKYEGNGVLSSEEGVLKDLTSVADEEKWSMKMNTAGATEQPNDNCHILQSPSEQTNRFGKEDSTSETNTSNLWSKLPKGSAAATSTTSWSKQSSADVSTPVQSRYHVGDLDLDDACPTSFDSAESQRETWDVLRTVETTGSDTFDLLSYLCDDEMRSPEGSVSTDSSTVSKLWPPVKSSVPVHQDTATIKTEDSIGARRRTEGRRTSTITSSSAETPVVTSRRSERTTRTSHRVEKSYSKPKREGQGRKRYIESDSDDRMSSTSSQYRESREKNNEASRKSRMNKKAKETEMAMRAVELERDNRILKMKVEELEKLVTSMRSALLRSALKKEF